jgi:DNA polymerase I
MLDALPHRHVIAADFEFEFGGHAGNRPSPVCMVAKDLRTGQTWRVWRGEFDIVPPFPIGADALFIAFYSSAELGCFKALGWPMPVNVLDLFVEFRNRLNGLDVPAGFGLIGALTYFGLDNIGAVEKDDMRSLILGGGPWSPE